MIKLIEMNYSFSCIQKVEELVTSPFTKVMKSRFHHNNGA